MKELDLLLARYLAERWDAAPDAERSAFGRILELPDPLLAAYLLGREQPEDPDLRGLVALLRGRAPAGVADPAGPPAAGAQQP